MAEQAIILVERIEKSILLIRGQKVMLSIDLAKLYGVETKILNQAVKRNIRRFPKDFMFQLNDSEVDFLVSQNVTPHKKYFGGHFPYAFTEQGVAMLSSVLRSKRAIDVNIEIMRTFVSLRKMIASNTKLAQKMSELEGRVGIQDEKIKAIFDAIKLLIEPPKKKQNPIGFRHSNN